MACHLASGDGPMSVVQLFNYLRHRYAGLPAYYLKDRDVVAIPLSVDAGEIAAAIRELAVRKGLACSEVSAAWPELIGPELALAVEAQLFLVVYAIHDS